MNDMPKLRAMPPQMAVHHQDGELVARFQAGDTSAFDELVIAHQGWVARLAHRLLGWSDDIEDVVQEVFVSVLENLHGFRCDAKFTTWLTTIVLNKCRSRRRRRFLRLDMYALLKRRKQIVAKNQTGESSEFHADVRRAVDGLPAKYREPIVLRYFEELSVGEISEALGISVNAVEVRLTRARQRLRETIELFKRE